jgi:hypothetical protein
MSPPRLLLLALVIAFSFPAHAAGLIAAAPPPAIITDLQRAHALADHIAACAATAKKPAEWAELVQTSRAQVDAVRGQAQALFGAIAVSGESATAPAPKCRRWSRADAGQEVTELTQSVQAGLSAIAGPTRVGLWLGLFPLCAQTVSEVTGQELPNRGWAITVRVRPSAAEILSPYSARFIRPDSPPGISFRVNGAELAQLKITEQISDALILTWTGDQVSYGLVMQAIAATCPAGLGGRA